MLGQGVSIYFKQMFYKVAVFSSNNFYQKKDAALFFLTFKLGDLHEFGLKGVNEIF